MIVQRRDNTKTKKPYPKLMKDTLLDVVVLFLNEGEGIVLDAFESSRFFGEHDVNWDMEDMVDYVGEITLCNN